MNMIYINDRSMHAESIKRVLIEQGVDLDELYYEPDDVEFLKTIMEIKKKKNINCLMSIGYYPTLSLACGAMEISYASWIMYGYKHYNYDYTIKNPWNRLFIVDPLLAAYLRNHNIENVKVLPLGFDDEIVEYVENHGENGAERQVFFWSDAIALGNTIAKSMKELRDSSIGYIDGVMECIKYDLRRNSIYSELPDYVRFDIESEYPYQIDSLESADIYYDNNYLFEHVDCSLGCKCIGNLIRDFSQEEIHIVSDVDYSKSKIGIRVISRKEAYQIIKEDHSINRVHVFIPSLKNGSAITEDMWNLMACGEYMLIPQYVDRTVVGQSVPESFKSGGEIRKLLEAYYKDMPVIAEKLEETSKRVRINCNYANRVQSIISCIQKEQVHS